MPAKYPLSQQDSTLERWWSEHSISHFLFLFSSLSLSTTNCLFFGGGNNPRIPLGEKKEIEGAQLSFPAWIFSSPYFLFLFLGFFICNGSELCGRFVGRSLLGHSPQVWFPDKIRSLGFFQLFFFRDQGKPGRGELPKMWGQKKVAMEPVR